MDIKNSEGLIKQIHDFNMFTKDLINFGELW